MCITFLTWTIGNFAIQIRLYSIRKRNSGVLECRSSHQIYQSALFSTFCCLALCRCSALDLPFQLFIYINLCLFIIYLWGQLIAYLSISICIFLNLNNTSKSPNIKYSFRLPVHHFASVQEVKLLISHAVLTTTTFPCGWFTAI